MNSQSKKTQISIMNSTIFKKKTFERMKLKFMYIVGPYEGNISS